MKFPGLSRRGTKGVYQYRTRVPIDIREHYGKREVNRSLGTSDEARAKEQYHRIAAEVQTEFNALRHSDEDAPQFEIKPASAREHYDRIKSQDFAYRVKIHREATEEMDSFWRQEIIPFPDDEFMSTNMRGF